MTRLEALLKEYHELYLYSIITHSTAIEGSTITEIENQLLFDEGISPGKPLAEQLMNLDLKAAYEKMQRIAAQHRDITVSELCSLSGTVMKNTGCEYHTITGDFDSSNGDLRRLNVSAGGGGKSYTAWQKVPEKLEGFCTWLNSERKRTGGMSPGEIYELSFEAHYRLLHIHPWADGNGRMSRLIMNLIQVEAGLIPSIVKRERRAGYIKSLAESRETESTKPFLEFMSEHHQENLGEQIREYKRSLDEDPEGSGSGLKEAGEEKQS